MEFKKVLFISFLLLFLTINTSARVRLNSSLTREYNVRKGEKYNDQFVLVNTGEEDEVIDLYIKDYSFNAEGQSFYLKPGKLTRSNSSWIELSSDKVILPGGVKRKISYKLNIPDKKNLKGTYWSLLMVEPQKSNIFQPLTVNKEENFNIRQNFRYGIQIITHIGNSGKSELKFTDPKIIKDREEYTFCIDCHNIGERWLRPKIRLALYSLKGKKIKEFYGRKMRLFPGTSIRQKIEMTGLKADNYKAILIADGGNNQVFGSRYELELQK